MSCGCKNFSKGELKIKNILQKLNISFKQEYKFKDCINPKTKYPLRFDFYLPDYNCCIEYDGEQHFIEGCFQNNDLKDRQYKDNIKNLYCKNNNIILIRIPYTDLKKINKEYLISLFRDRKVGYER